MHGVVGIQPRGRWRLQLVAIVALTVLISCGEGTPDEIAAESLHGRAFESTSVSGSDLLDDTLVEVEFFRNGQITFSAGCNVTTAELKLLGGSLHLSQASTTEIECADDLHEQAQWLHDFMMDEPAYEIANERLTLSAEEAAIVLEERR